MRIPSLPVKQHSNKFDLVHVDCDWYESVKMVIKYLQYHLVPPAIIHIDDWSHWQGCRSAVIESGYLKYPHDTRGGALIVQIPQVDQKLSLGKG